MDQPLFGEQRKEAKVLQYLAIFIVVGFTLAAIITGAIKGISDPQKFALVATVVVAFANLAVLARWYYDKEDRLHPKFKYLVIGFVALILLTDTTAMVFSLNKPPPCTTLPTCDGCLIYQYFDAANTPQYSYISISNLPVCLNATSGGGCVRMYGSYGTCYQNCSLAGSFEMDEGFEINSILRSFARLELDSPPEQRQIEAL